MTAPSCEVDTTAGAIVSRSVSGVLRVGASTKKPLPKRVLIVDDEPGLRRLLGDIFASEGYLVSEASDGMRGLDRAWDQEPWSVLRRRSLCLLRFFATALFNTADRLNAAEIARTRKGIHRRAPGFKFLCQFCHGRTPDNSAIPGVPFAFGFHSGKAARG